MDENNKTDILLESGTNEIGIMEFTIADHAYGINISKVREIMRYCDVVPMQKANPFVEGVFKPRDLLITVINLPKYLKLPDEHYEDKDLFIITDFNKMRIAFRVNSVKGIARMSWENITKPDITIYGGTEGVATGIADYQGRLITILDFEKIVADISPDSSIKIEDIEVLGNRARKNCPILIAEDSMLLSKLIVDSLHKAGYVNIIQTNNGLEAWNYLQEVKEHGEIDEHVACLITDIEMPQMDGHRLTKLVKEDKELKHLPVVIFSSLINDEMKVKGNELGADVQISKPEIAKLVTVLDDLTINKKEQ